MRAVVVVNHSCRLPPEPVQSTYNFDPVIFGNPYSLVSAGGINPATADDFHEILHFTLAIPVSTPEPASLALGSGVLGLVLARRRRR